MCSTDAKCLSQLVFRHKKLLCGAHNKTSTLASQQEGGGFKPRPVNMISPCLCGSCSSSRLTLRFSLVISLYNICIMPTNSPIIVHTAANCIYLLSSTEPASLPLPLCWALRIEKCRFSWVHKCIKWPWRRLTQLLCQCSGACLCFTTGNKTAEAFF